MIFAGPLPNHYASYVCCTSHGFNASIYTDENRNFFIIALRITSGLNLQKYRRQTFKMSTERTYGIRSTRHLRSPQSSRIDVEGVKNLTNYRRVRVRVHRNTVVMVLTSVYIALHYIALHYFTFYITLISTGRTQIASNQREGALIYSEQRDIYLIDCRTSYDNIKKYRNEELTPQIFFLNT